MVASEYDVIVVGAGHAGVEAAAAAARCKANTLLLTDNYDLIGQMSCNPAIGGLAKGQIVLEVDALGGLMGRITEKAGIQFKVLNKSKGPAVQAPRAQCDRQLYQREARRLLEQQDNLTIKQDRVIDIKTCSDRITGLKTISNTEYKCKSVVLCTGTFLRGLIHIGDVQLPGGRMGEKATTQLSASLERLGFERQRLKTGTPPRIDGRSVDYSAFIRQDGDSPTPEFSFYSDYESENLRPCWQGATNKRTHRIIRDNLHRSPLYGTGVIKGTGVRYCPSIEDKVVKFDQQNQHTVFLEPEGLDSCELYANGIPTSLPADVQLDMIHSIEGLQAAEITRWGYAIEYDFFQPTQLKATLETKHLPGLFFAGQINGTTGYEEAAGQGLMAGANAALQALSQSDFVLSRTEAYIGVLIDELVTKGTNEPFRMFTSRAEHRLQLRSDNAHYRLTPRGQAIGLIGSEIWDEFRKEKDDRKQLKKKLNQTRITPSSEQLKTLKKIIPSLNISRGVSCWELLKRPEINIENLLQTNIIPAPERRRIAEHLGIKAKYEGYIKRQQNKIEKARQLEAKKIPTNFEYDQIPQLSNEAVEKLTAISPRNLAQANRISGIKPTDIQVLMLYLNEHKH